jgi:Mg/Co/Ni transporter MgtE
MKKGKRFLCLLLVVAMTLSIMSTGVLAATVSADDATAQSSYESSTSISLFADLSGLLDGLKAKLTDNSLLSKLNDLLASKSQTVSDWQTFFSDLFKKDVNGANDLISSIISGNTAINESTLKALASAFNDLTDAQAQNLIKALSVDNIKDLLGILHNNNVAAFDKLVSLLPSTVATDLLKQAMADNKDIVGDMIANFPASELQGVISNFNDDQLQALMSLLGSNSTAFKDLLNAMPSAKLTSLVNSFLTNNKDALATAISANKDVILGMLNSLPSAKLADVLKTIVEYNPNALAAALATNKDVTDLLIKNLPSAKLAAFLEDMTAKNLGALVSVLNGENMAKVLENLSAASLSAALKTLSDDAVNNMLLTLKGNAEALNSLVSLLPSSRLASLMKDLLNSSSMGTILQNLSPANLAAALKALAPVDLNNLINQLTGENLAKVLAQLDTTTLAGLLGKLGTDNLTAFQNIINALDPSKLASALAILKTANADALSKILNGSSLTAILSKLGSADLLKSLSDANLKNVQALMDIIVGNSTAAKNLLETLSQLNASALNNLLNLMSKTQLAQLLSKLGLPSIADLLAKFSSSDLVTLFKNLLAKGFSFDQIKTFIANLIGSTTNSSLLAKLKALLDNLKALLGLGSSDTDINDDKTPLAGGMLTTDHIAYVQGVGNGKFLPYGPMTRAAAAQMLFNLLTDDSREMYYSTSSTFSDVSSGSWYSAAVSTLANADVINGYPDGSFKPDRAISRAEFIKLIVAMFGVDESATASYTDLKTTNWAYPYIATATANGWITGYTDGSCKPTNSIQRGEAVTFMNRVLSRTCDTSYVAANLSSLKTFTDVKTNLWCYAAVMEAANGHNYSTSTGSEVWTGLK